MLSAKFGNKVTTASLGAPDARSLLDRTGEPGGPPQRRLDRARAFGLQVAAIPAAPRRCEPFLHDPAPHSHATFRSRSDRRRGTGIDGRADHSPRDDSERQRQGADPHVSPRRRGAAEVDRAVHIWLDAGDRPHHPARPVCRADGVPREHPCNLDLLAASRRCTPLRAAIAAHSFVITFDDGRLSPWYNAVPLLRKDGFTAVFFPCQGLIGEKGGPADVSLGGPGTAAGYRRILGGGPHLQRRSRVVRSERQHAECLDQPHQGGAAAPHRCAGAIPRLHGHMAVAACHPGRAREASVFATLASYGYVGGVLDVRVASATEMSAQLWQLPRVRIGCRPRSGPRRLVLRLTRASGLEPRSLEGSVVDKGKFGESRAPHSALSRPLRCLYSDGSQR